MDADGTPSDKPARTDAAPACPLIAFAGLMAPPSAPAAGIPMSQANSAEFVGAPRPSDAAAEAWLEEVVRPVTARTRPDVRAARRVSLHP